MTKDEFKAWMEETKRSEYDWQIDRIQWENNQIILAYIGGTDGVFVECSSDGIASIGRYEGAIPHICESIFTTSYSAKVGENASEAFKFIAEKLGVRFLVSLFSAH